MGCWFSCLSALIPTPGAPCRVGLLACAAWALACSPLSLRRALPFTARPGAVTARPAVSTFAGSTSLPPRDRSASVACSATWVACAACAAVKPPLSRMRAASRRLTARLAAAFGCFSAAGGDAVPFAGTELALANTIVMVLPCFLTEVAPASSASSTARRKSCHALPPPDRRRVDVATSPAGPLAACAAARAGEGGAFASPISLFRRSRFT